MASDLRISGEQTFPYSESDIRININDPNKIIAAANATGGNGQQGQFYSYDGGSSWNQVDLPLNPGDHHHSDPCVDWTLQGASTAWTITLGIDLGLFGPNTRLRCFKSIDEGATWVFDSDVTTQTGVDKPMMWVDRSATMHRDNIYAIWQNNGPVFAARRLASSGIWQAQLQISDSQHTGSGIGADIKTNSLGHVFALWPDSGSGKLFVAKSTDGGGTFSTPYAFTQTFGRLDIQIPAFTNRKALIYVTAGAFYRSTFEDFVYAVWTDLTGVPGTCDDPTKGPGLDASSPCKTRIWFSRSTDGGYVWSVPRMINPYNLALSNNDQFNPKLAVDESNGRLAVMYYDTIGDPERLKTDVWMQTSDNDGVTWSQAFRVTSAQTDETADGADPGNQYGDYNGMSGHNGNFFPCWTDRRMGLREEIWSTGVTTNAVLPPISVPRKALHLFIRPPYDDWQVVHAYGPEDPPPAEPVTHNDVLLETTGMGNVYAAAAGKLTIELPGSPVGDPVELADPSTFTVPAIAVSLHLDLNQQSIPEALRTAAGGFGNLRGFRYTNVDLPSLIAALAADLAAKGSITVGTGPVRSEEQIAIEVLTGERSLPVSKGQLIGQASMEGAPANTRRVGFGVLTDSGPIDPSYIYDTLRDFVFDGLAAVASYLDLAENVWPLLPPTASEEILLGFVSQKLYPMAVLDTLRPENNSAVSASTWRKVGDAQKSQWLQRLRVRAGHPLGGDTAPPFEFDYLDAQNLFQLEALVEFYANFPDPWAPGGVIVNPGESGYRKVDFLDPSGTNATTPMAGSMDVILNPTGDQDATAIRTLLDNTMSFTNVEAGAKKIYDLLILYADNNPARPKQTYRIVSIDPMNPRLTLDAAPNLAGASSWTIRRRPTLVIVDSFGGRVRLRGKNATVNPPGGNVLKLEIDGPPPLTPPDLTRVNGQFDTIYLPSTTGVNRSYRIQSVTGVDTVQLGSSPPGGPSRWHVPAGVGGLASDQEKPPKSASASGYDNYDGAMFIVYRSKVQTPPYKPWTSLSSWESQLETLGSCGASILGNASLPSGLAAYAINSFRSVGSSDDAFRNFCFRVTDVGLAFDASKRFGDADSVADSRFYFTSPVTVNAVGQTEVRIQSGEGTDPNRKSRTNHGNASRGGLASLNFARMRSRLIMLHKQEVLDLGGILDESFEELASKLNTSQGKRYYRRLKFRTGWDNAIVGQLWLIRPDERPLG